MYKKLATYIQLKNLIVFFFFIFVFFLLFGQIISSKPYILYLSKYFVNKTYFNYFAYFKCLLMH